VGVLAARLPAGSGEPIQYHSAVDQSDLSNAIANDINMQSLNLPKMSSFEANEKDHVVNSS